MIDFLITSGFVQYLSNYFEIFFLVSIVFICVGLLVQISLRLRELDVKNVLRRTFQQILFSTVVLGQIVLIMMAGYLFWVNYKYPASALEFSKDIFADTSWVKDNLTVYFIDGNSLMAVNVNGANKHNVLTLSDPIKEYHFSSDGNFLIVVSIKEIYLIDLKSADQWRIDSWAQEGVSAQWSGSIGGVRWSPDSRYFCYNLARWSSFSSQNYLYIYDLAQKERSPIESPLRQISSFLYWDKDGKNLYYLERQALDTSKNAYPFDVNVFRIPLDSRHPEFVSKIPFDQTKVPIPNLKTRGIDLFLEGDNLSFIQDIKRDILVSDQGKRLDVDKDDHLFYVPNQWFRHRLFKIPREPQIGDISRHQYRGGDLAITQICWIPGGQYAIMLHRYLGVLVIEPSTHKIGLLIEARGNTFGWYKPLTHTRRLTHALGMPSAPPEWLARVARVDRPHSI